MLTLVLHGDTVPADALARTLAAHPGDRVAVLYHTALAGDVEGLLSAGRRDCPDWPRRLRSGVPFAAYRTPPGRLAAAAAAFGPFVLAPAGAAFAPAADRVLRLALAQGAPVTFGFDAEWAAGAGVARGLFAGPDRGVPVHLPEVLCRLP